jgi:hypothetical protein
MRSIKLIPALVAMATLCAVAPTLAAAHPARRHPAKRQRSHAVAVGACHVRIQAPKGPIAAEEPITIFGALSCPTAEQAVGKQVSLYQQSAGKGAFALVATATTEAGGLFQFKPPPFSTNSVFYVLAQGAQSAHRTVRVSPAVTLASPTEGTPLFTAGGHPQRAHLVMFKGAVSAADAGAVVALQREDSTATEEWHRIGKLSHVSGNGEYAIPHVFGVPGTAELRVVVRPPRGVNAPGASDPVSFVISQPQNPLLSILGSADPLSYGQSVSISGVVAGAADKTPVTLMARSRGTGFAPVATGQTTGSGYTFMQTPLENTLYRVVSGTHSSSTLVEAVRYGITAAVSTPSAPAGQALTFSGTVTGAPAGHVVYLERRRVGGIGFNVVDIGTVLGGGPLTSYSIPHAFLGAGESEVRLKVPGDPGHGGKASAPMKITITPSPASALRPEAPGNSKLPGEGQI